MSKEDILTKFKTKDYNNELEEILERKEFSNDVKNLLLNMLYKIEAGYNDYKKVKIDVLDKKIIIEEIVRSVKENCASIILAEPKEKNTKKDTKFKIDYENHSITSYPSEKDLLKAIYNISFKDIETEGIEKIIKDSLSKFINIGYSNDLYEIIRDFNGWNWYTSPIEITDFEYNIIYQNMKILTNNEYLYYIKNGEGENIDFDKSLKEELSKSIDEQKVEEFTNLVYKLILMLNQNKQSDIERIIEIRDENEKILKELENKEKYSEELFKEQKKYMIKVRQIDEILNDPKKLNEEFMKRNNQLDDENKIFSLSNLTEVLTDERKENEIAIKKISSKLASLKYTEEVENSKEIERFINNLEIDKSFNIKRTIIQLQKVFLNCFMEFILRAENKKQMIELIYTFRYYCLLYYNEQYQIKDLKELKEDIEKIKNALIEKSIKIKMINDLSVNEILNANIISPIFEIRNIDLKDIEIKVSEDIVNDNTIQIEYLDNGLTEKTKNLEIENISQIKGLKFNKKIEVFN